MCVLGGLCGGEVWGCVWWGGCVGGCCIEQGRILFFLLKMLHRPFLKEEKAFANTERLVDSSWSWEPASDWDPGGHTVLGDTAEHRR